MAHPQSHINKIEATRNLAPIEGGDSEYWKDAYACPGSAQAALFAAGTTIDLVLKIVDSSETSSNSNNSHSNQTSEEDISSINQKVHNSHENMRSKVQSDNAVALVRPPGHHAETNVCMGFCYYNNAALAAYAALNRKYQYSAAASISSESPEHSNPSHEQHEREQNPIRRVLIVDWDVHHGNGTQRIFEDDPRVLYISLHRYPFYPNTGAYNEVGKGEGVGYTVNIGWPEGGVGDVEYLAAFRQIIMPIAEQFNPDLVLISAGFDAALGDPLGGCCLTPVGYAHMTHQLLSLAKGKLMLILEGGYNLKSIASSAEACIRIMLGEEPPPLPEKGST